MTATLRLDVLQGPHSYAYAVTEIHPDGDGGMLAEFVTRHQALRFAHAYAARFNCKLQSAEVIPFGKAVAA